MKKVLLTTALLAIVAGNSSADISGKYVALETGYTWTKASVQKKTAAPKINYNQGGFGLFGKVGGGCNYSGVYVGGEFKGGKVFSKKKNGTTNLSRGWNLGVAGRVGGHIDNDTLLYGRLGLDVDQYSYLRAGATRSGDIVTLSIVPGFGVDRKISQDVFVTAGVDFSKAVKVSSPAASKASKFRSTSLRLGVGYQF